MRDRERGLRSCSKKAVTLFSQECPRGLGWFLLVHFRHSPPRHLSSSLFCLSVHTRSHMYKHTQPSHLFFSGETRFYLQNSHCLTAPLLYPPPQTRRSPSCPPFVYFTPSIMQGLISQSRFELRHASAKSGEQNFCAGGSFPFTLA